MRAVLRPSSLHSLSSALVSNLAKSCNKLLPLIMYQPTATTIVGHENYRLFMFKLVKDWVAKGTIFLSLANSHLFMHSFFRNYPLQTSDKFRRPFSTSFCVHLCLFSNQRIHSFTFLLLRDLKAYKQHNWRDATFAYPCTQNIIPGVIIYIIHK